MKPKKSKKANLEKFRTIFFQVGMILTLSAILVAFEWKSSVEIEKLPDSEINWTDIEDFPPITRPEPEPIEMIKPPIFEIDIVPDEDIVPDIDLEHLISEIGEGDGIEIIEFIENDEKIIEEFVKVEIMPTFRGKDGRYFRNFVANKMKFPLSAIESGVTGTVIAAFVIDENGKVSNAKITRSVHPIIDEAVLKVIKNSPEWEPGIQEGRPVRVRYSIAIAFQLQ
ncbi:MAG: energy transducer TonB [Bacteroidales bacterium]|jgi:protein TonB|nr:energy transducer TonB [Bacteroidales bacterium]